MGMAGPEVPERLEVARVGRAAVPGSISVEARESAPLGQAGRRQCPERAGRVPREGRRGIPQLVVRLETAALTSVDKVAP